jgi:protein-tyrosine phosphatase
MLNASQFTRRWLKSATLRFGLNSRKIDETLPREICSILFVCKGNICRSPFAASYLAARLKGRDCPIEVSSAGLECEPGGKANPVASTVALQNQISLEAHVTTPVSRDIIGRADLILVMEFMQCVDLLKKFPEAERKVFRLGDFHKRLAREIWDPYGGTHADFEFCFRMIRRCCDNLTGALISR